MSFINNYREIVSNSESFITHHVATYNHPKPSLFLHFIPTSPLKSTRFPWEMDAYNGYPEAQSCFQKWFAPLTVNPSEQVIAFGKRHFRNVAIDVYSNGCIEFVTDGIATSNGDIGFFVAESFILRALNAASTYYTAIEIETSVRCFVSLKNVRGLGRYMKEGGNSYGHLKFKRDQLTYGLQIDDFASILTEGVSEKDIPDTIPSKALKLIDHLWQEVGSNGRPDKPHG